MRTAAEIRAGIGALITVQVTAVFGTIFLLVRMAPALEHVLQENVATNTAVEEMYAAMAARDCGLSQAEAEATFEDALDRAHANVTLDGEETFIDRVSMRWQDALRGDCDARDVVITNLDHVADLNRSQMEVADRAAQRLGIVGAWTAAALGLVTFAVAAVVIRRFMLRIAAPIGEIEAVLQAASQGDPYRRCRRLDAPAEYGVIAARLNMLLDRRLARDETEDPQIRAMDRALLQFMLDRCGDAVVAVDRSGAMIAASDRALDVLAGRGIESIAGALQIGPQGESETGLVLRVESFGKNAGFLVTLNELESDPPTAERAKVLAAKRLGDDDGERPVAQRAAFNPLADRGAADSAPAAPAAPTGPAAPPRVPGKPDWQQD